MIYSNYPSLQMELLLGDLKDQTATVHYEKDGQRCCVLAVIVEMGGLKVNVLSELRKQTYRDIEFEIMNPKPREKSTEDHKEESA